MRTLVDYLIYVCAFCVIGVGGLGAWDAVARQPAGLGRGSDLPGDAAGVLPEPFAGVDRGTVLIMGADERPKYGDRGRSDTMIVLFVNPRTKQAALLSIPRDLRARIPGHGMQKINASFSLGGVELVRETIEDLLEIDIDYYAKAHFQSFVEVVDRLGGVEIDVPDVEGRGRGMNYDDRADGLHIHLKPGVQVLDGAEAMGFVRYRKGDSDFKRSERQQQFLKAMAEQKLKLRNVPQLLKITPKVLEAIETDMHWREAVDLARVLRAVRPDCVMSASFEEYLRERKFNGVYYVVVERSDINRVLTEIDQHLKSMPGQMNLVEVLNGSGRTGAAADAGAILSEAGFEILDTANADRFDYGQTVIYHPTDGLSAARRVQRLLGTGRLVELDTDSELRPDRITVIVGSDLAGGDDGQAG